MACSNREKEREAAYMATTEESDSASTAVMGEQEGAKAATSESEMEVDGTDPTPVKISSPNSKTTSAVLPNIPTRDSSISPPKIALTAEENETLERIGYPTNRDGTPMSDIQLKDLGPESRRDLFEVIESLIIGRRGEISKLAVDMALSSSDVEKDKIRAALDVQNAALVTLIGNVNHLSCLFDVQLSERVAQPFDPDNPPLPAHNPYSGVLNRPETPMDTSRAGAGHDGQAGGKKLEFNPITKKRNKTRSECWDEVMEKALLLKENWTTGANGALGPSPVEEKPVSPQVDPNYPRRAKHYMDLISQRRDKWYEVAEAQGKIRPKTVVAGDKIEEGWNEEPDETSQEELMGHPMRDYKKLMLAMCTHVLYASDDKSKNWYTECKFSTDTLLNIETIWRPGQRCPYMVCRHEEFNYHYGIEVFNDVNLFFQHLCEMHAPCNWYYLCPISGGGCKVRVDRLAQMIGHIKYSQHKKGEALARKMVEDLIMYTERNPMYAKGRWLTKADHYTISVVSGKITESNDGKPLREIPIPSTWSGYTLPDFPTAGAIYGKNLDRFKGHERVVRPTSGSSEFRIQPMSVGVQARKSAEVSALSAQNLSNVSDSIPGDAAVAELSPSSAKDYVLRDCSVQLRRIPAGSEGRSRNSADEIIHKMLFMLKYLKVLIPEYYVRSC